MAFKLTIIGAGSLTFARTLFSDIMHVPELRGLEVAFTDINQQNLDMVTQLCQRDLCQDGRTSDRDDRIPSLVRSGDPDHGSLRRILAADPEETPPDDRVRKPSGQSRLGDDLGKSFLSRKDHLGDDRGSRSDLSRHLAGGDGT